MWYFVLYYANDNNVKEVNMFETLTEAKEDACEKVKEGVYNETEIVKGYPIGSYSFTPFILDDDLNKVAVRK